LSHSKRFVLLLPWKTASQTMRLRLLPYNESPYSPFFHFNPYLGRVVHQHITAADFLGLPESTYGHLVAAFIRNPYDRTYAGFVQLQRDIQTQPQAEYPAQWVRDLVMQQLASNFLELARARFDFNTWVTSIREEQVFEAGRNTNWPLHPVHDWTHVADRQVVDHIGRVETFEVDFQALLARVGIRDVTQESINVTDMGASNTNPFGYRHVHRMSPEAIRTINRLFARDFDLFGYPQLPV
jgi:hypothetical protein